MARNFTPSAPNQILWVVALVVGLLGLIGHFTRIEFVSENHFWMVAAGFVLLVIGTSLRGI